MSYLMNQIQNLIQISKQQESYEPYYEVLQSITFSGNEYFDTGVLGDVNTKIEAGIFLKSMPSVEADGNYYIFGSRSGSATANNIDCIWSWQSGLVCDFNNSAYATYRLSVGKTNLALNTVYDVTVNKNKRDISRNGTSLGSNTTANSDTFTSTNTICIGLVNGANISSYTGFDGGLTYFKINDDDYIPVLDSQMRPCLYDRVSKTFIYAKKIADGTDATSTLTYKRWNKFDVDYIENTGTAYIPFADITPSATMGMNIEYAYTTLSSAEPAGVIGTYNGDTQRKDTFFVSTSSGYTQKASSPSSASCGVMVFHRGGNVGTSSSTSATYVEPEKDVWYTATVNWLGDGEIYWTDGTNELTNDVGANAVVTNQLRLFSRCNSSNSTYNNCKSRVRKLQFSDGSNIIRSYIPVVWHNSDTTAVATLYDEVYNKMCTPSGSLKAYIVGADSTVYEVGRSVSGTPSSSVSGVSNCFDTGLYGTQDTTVKYIAIAYDNESTSGQLFGSYDGTQTTSKNLTINSTGTSGNTAPIRFDGKVTTTPIRIAINKSVSIINSKYGLWVNDTLHASWGSVNDFTTTTTMLILKCNNSANTRNNGCGYCMLLDKDVPIAEYIPVKNGSTIGLYDKVSKTLNTGEGTINFNVLD